MTLPTVPLFLVLSLLPGVSLSVAGLWWLRNKPRSVALSIPTVALGITLLLVSVLSLGAYAFELVSGPSGSRWQLAALLLPYAAVIVLLAQVRKVSGSSLVIAACLGAIPLYVVALFAGLFAACSFGDCL